MESPERTINISDLPEYARKELLDFYEFLRTKYKIDAREPPRVQRTPLSRFVSRPIKVKKIKRYSRDELYDR